MSRQAMLRITAALSSADRPMIFGLIHERPLSLGPLAAMVAGRGSQFHGYVDQHPGNMCLLCPTAWVATS
jgi:hypothetical protein